MGGGQSGPPDKLVEYDLSTYPTADTRAAAISGFIQAFNQKYRIYPNIILVDSVVNALYLGWYGAQSR